MRTSYRDFGWNRQVFEQIWKREGRTLPIFDAETTLLYDRRRRLAAVVAETHPAEDIAVTSPVGALTAAEAKAVVRQAFGLDASVLTDVQEGIFLVGGQPGNARTAFEVGVTAGEEQEDILVYVDSETQAILSIE